MSVAESSCAKRSSSIFASSSAIGCSKSRNAVFIGRKSPEKRAILPESSGAPWRAARAGSILDGDRIEAAPEIPGCDRAPGAPGGGDPAHRSERDGPPLEIVEANRALQPQIVQRQHIRAQQAKHQEHLRSPATDASNLDELRDDRLVLHLGPSLDVQARVNEVAGEPGEILGLAPGKAASDEPRVARIDDLSGEHSRRERDDTCPDARGSLDRYLLADDRARQREERLAARLERDAGMIANDPREHRITAGERAFGPIPVYGCRAPLHEREASGRLRRRFCGFIRTTLLSSIDKAR